MPSLRREKAHLRERERGKCVVCVYAAVLNGKKMDLSLFIIRVRRRQFGGIFPPSDLILLGPQNHHQHRSEMPSGERERERINHRIFHVSISSQKRRTLSDFVYGRPERGERQLFSIWLCILRVFVEVQSANRGPLLCGGDGSGTIWLVGRCSKRSTHLPWQISLFGDDAGLSVFWYATNC